MARRFRVQQQDFMFAVTEPLESTEVEGILSTMVTLVLTQADPKNSTSEQHVSIGPEHHEPRGNRNHVGDHSTRSSLKQSKPPKQESTDQKQVEEFSQIEKDSSRNKKSDTPHRRDSQDDPRFEKNSPSDRSHNDNERHEEEETSKLSGGNERVIVVQTGSRTRERLEDSVAATSVITRQDFQERGATTVDRALTGESALTLNYGIGGLGLRLGGLGPEYTAILVNGRRLTGRIGGTLDLRGLRLENIEQIEIVRGPASALYGADALAGTINLVTRRAVKAGWQGDASFMGGSRRTFDGGGSLFYGYRRWRWALFGGGDRADDWRHRKNSVATTGDATAGWHLGADMGWQNRSQEVHLRADYERRGFAGIDSLASGAVFDRRKLRERLVSRISSRFQNSDSVISSDLAFTTFRDQYALDQRKSDALDDYQDTRHHGLQAGSQLDQQLNEHTWTSGVDFQGEYLSTARIDPSQVTRFRIGLFSQDRWTPKKLASLQLLPGIRLDYDSYFGLYLSPRIAASFRVRELTVRPALGRGYRAPDLREMYLSFDNAGVGYQVRGNPDLGPETSWSGTLDLDWKARSWLRIGGHGFCNFLQNAIVTGVVRAPQAGQPTLYSYMNVGRVRSLGAEARVGSQVGNFLRISASYQYTHAVNVDEERRLQGQAPHVFTVDLRTFVGPMRWRTSLGGRLNWNSSRPFYTSRDGNVNSMKAPAYTQLELRLAQSLTRYGEVFLNVRNLANVGDDRFNALAPRTFLAGASGRF